MRRKRSAHEAHIGELRTRSTHQGGSARRTGHADGRAIPTGAVRRAGGWTRLAGLVGRGRRRRVGSVVAMTVTAAGRLRAARRRPASVERHGVRRPGGCANRGRHARRRADRRPDRSGHLDLTPPDSFALCASTPQISPTAT